MRTCAARVENISSPVHSSFRLVQDGLNILQEEGDDADVVETALLKVDQNCQLEAAAVRFSLMVCALQGVLHLRYVLQGFPTAFRSGPLHCLESSSDGHSG